VVRSVAAHGAWPVDLAGAPLDAQDGALPEVQDGALPDVQDGALADVQDGARAGVLPVGLDGGVRGGLMLGGAGDGAGAFRSQSVLV
jgi:hypothetical protein